MKMNHYFARIAASALLLVLGSFAAPAAFAGKIAIDDYQIPNISPNTGMSWLYGGDCSENATGTTPDCGSVNVQNNGAAKVALGTTITIGSGSYDAVWVYEDGLVSFTNLGDTTAAPAIDPAAGFSSIQDSLGSGTPFVATAFTDMTSGFVANKDVFGFLGSEQTGVFFERGIGIPGFTPDPLNDGTPIDASTVTTVPALSLLWAGNIDGGAQTITAQFTLLMGPDGLQMTFNYGSFARNDPTTLSDSVMGGYSINGATACWTVSSGYATDSAMTYTIPNTGGTSTGSCGGTTTTPVPEPGSLALFSAGVLGMWVVNRRRERKIWCRR